MSRLTAPTGIAPLRLHIPPAHRPARRADDGVRRHDSHARRDAPSLAPADPRWVLAVRTGEALQGATLGPDDREQLIRTGRMLGLNPFQANLVIAIVQDQARRGLGPADGAGELAFVPLIGPRPRRPAWRAALIAGAVVLIETLILWALL